VVQKTQGFSWNPGVFLESEDFLGTRKFSSVIGTRPERPSSVPRKEYVKYRLKKIPDYLNKNLNIGITDKGAQVNLKGSFATSLNFYLDILDYFGL